MGGYARQLAAVACAAAAARGQETACDPGARAVGGACELCPYGTYQDEANATECKELDGCAQIDALAPQRMRPGPYTAGRTSAESLLQGPDAAVDNAVAQASFVESEPGLRTNPCAARGAWTAVCTDVPAPGTGNTCDCIDDRAYRAIYYSAGPDDTEGGVPGVSVGWTVCRRLESDLGVPLITEASVLFSGAISARGFRLAMTEATDTVCVSGDEVTFDCRDSNAEVAELDERSGSVDILVSTFVSMAEGEITVTGQVHDVSDVLNFLCGLGADSSCSPLLEALGCEESCGPLAVTLLSSLTTGDVTELRYSYEISASRELSTFNAAAFEAECNRTAIDLGEDLAEFVAGPGVEVTAADPSIRTNVSYTVVAEDEIGAARFATANDPEAGAAARSKLQAIFAKYCNSTVAIASQSCPQCGEIKAEHDQGQLMLYLAIAICGFLCCCYPALIGLYGKHTGAMTGLSMNLNKGGDGVFAVVDDLESIAKQPVKGAKKGANKGKKAAKKGKKAAKKGKKHTQQALMSNPMYGDGED